MKRRTLLKIAVSSALASPAIAQSQRTATLRFVPEVNLDSLDPIISFAGATKSHGYAVYDMLYGIGSDNTPRPQMAAGHDVSDDGRTWSITLRDGLRFHDGEPVRAIDCAVSMERWARRDTYGQTLASFVDRWDAADDKTLKIHLTRPFPGLLSAISHPAQQIAAIMPERIARTDASVQIRDPVGSGPFRFIKDEYVSGSRAVYQRFDGYVPREDRPDYTSGAKIAHFPRIEWHVLPDIATQTAALQSGEVDWLEFADGDTIGLLARNSKLGLQVQDPTGRMSFARFNMLHPPFDKPAIRRAVLGAVNQSDYMDAITGGDPRSYRQCYSMFPLGYPFVSQVGAALMQPPIDLAKQRTALMAAGYAGEPVVILNASDSASTRPHGEITADLLKKLGMNVDLQTMDWGTLVQRRNNKASPAKGGWSMIHTNWASATIANPAMHVGIRGLGTKGYPGWFDNADMEQLVAEWVAADGDADQQRLFDAIQHLAFRLAPSVPLGQYTQQTAFSNRIRDILPGAAAFMWNVRPA